MEALSSVDNYTAANRIAEIAAGLDNINPAFISFFDHEGNPLTGDQASQALSEKKPVITTCGNHSKAPKRVFFSDGNNYYQGAPNNIPGDYSSIFNEKGVLNRSVSTKITSDIDNIIKNNKKDINTFKGAMYAQNNSSMTSFMLLSGVESLHKARSDTSQTVVSDDEFYQSFKDMLCNPSNLAYTEDGIRKAYGIGNNVPKFSDAEKKNRRQITETIADSIIDYTKKRAASTEALSPEIRDKISTNSYGRQIRAFFIRTDKDFAENNRVLEDYFSGDPERIKSAIEQTLKNFISDNTEIMRNPNTTDADIAKNFADIRRFGGAAMEYKDMMTGFRHMCEDNGITLDPDIVSQSEEAYYHGNIVNSIMVTRGDMMANGYYQYLDPSTTLNPDQLKNLTTEPDRNARLFIEASRTARGQSDFAMIESAIHEAIGNKNLIGIYDESGNRLDRNNDSEKIMEMASQGKSFIFVPEDGSMPTVASFDTKSGKIMPRATKVKDLKTVIDSIKSEMKTLPHGGQNVEITANKFIFDSKFESIKADRTTSKIEKSLEEDVMYQQYKISAILRGQEKNPHFEEDLRNAVAEMITKQSVHDMARELNDNIKNDISAEREQSRKNNPAPANETEKESKMRINKENSADRNELEQRSKDLFEKLSDKKQMKTLAEFAKNQPGFEDFIKEIKEMGPDKVMGMDAAKRSREQINNTLKAAQKQKADEVRSQRRQQILDNRQKAREQLSTDKAAPTNQNTKGNVK